MPTAAEFQPTTSSVQEMEFHSDALDPDRVKAAYDTHGAVIVRGLSRDYVKPLLADIEEILGQSQSLLPSAQPSPTHPNGVVTPDGTLFARDGDRFVVNSLQLNSMVSAAFLASMLNPTLLDLLARITGPDLELWKWGQCVYKQPKSGVPKSLHQDGYYFEHKLQSPVAVLSYAVEVDELNGPLFVVPGSHALGLIEHTDDKWAGFALNDPIWWQKAVPITGAAGDAVIFHTCTIHGSPDNQSERPRPVYIQRYRRSDDFCVIDVATSAARRDAERHPLSHKQRSDWGLMVRGLRRFTS